MVVKNNDRDYKTMPSYQLKNLNSRHFKIVDLAIKGWSETAIAEQVNMSKRHVCIIMSSPTFKHEFALRRGIHEVIEDETVRNEENEVDAILKDGARAAANKLITHVASDESNISIKACAEVLDRSGYGKQIKQSTGPANPTIIINLEDTQIIRDTIVLDSKIVESKTVGVETK